MARSPRNYVAADPKSVGVCAGVAHGHHSHDPPAVVFRRPGLKGEAVNPCSHRSRGRAAPRSHRFCDVLGGGRACPARCLGNTPGGKHLGRRHGNPGHRLRQLGTKKSTIRRWEMGDGCREGPRWLEGSEVVGDIAGEVRCQSEVQGRGKRWSAISSGWSARSTRWGRGWRGRVKVQLSLAPAGKRTWLLFIPSEPG